MRLAVMWIMLIIICVLTYDLRSKSADIKDLEHKLHDHTVMADLDVQARCAKQAGEEFRREGFGTEAYDGYTNHYNPGLAKCFVQISRLKVDGDDISIQEELVDAFEGKVYGSYLWNNPEHKKVTDVQSVECEVIQPSGEEKRCQSQEEYDTLSKRYME